MHRWFRIALTWLLVMALPVQGWAAVTMAACGPSHHRMAHVESAASAVHDHAEHGHGHGVSGSAAEVHHHDGADGGAADVLAHGHHAVLSDEEQQLNKLSKFKCSACSLCHVTMAMPAAGVRIDPVWVSNFVAPTVPQTAAQFLTDGPERPPRSLLA